MSDSVTQRRHWHLGDYLHNAPHDLLVYEKDQVRASEVLAVVLPVRDDESSLRISRWTVIVPITAILALITFALSVGNQ